MRPHWWMAAVVILGIALSASGCSMDAESQVISPESANTGREQLAVEQTASRHLARTNAQLQDLRQAWLVSRQPMNDGLLHGVAEVESRLEAATRALAFVRYSGREDLDDMRQSLTPALDDVDRRIERLRRDTRARLDATAAVSALQR